MPSALLQRTRVQQFVEYCARRTLSAAQLDGLREAGGALDPTEWTAVAARAQEQRLSPLVFAHCSRAGLLPAMPETVVAELRHAYADTRTCNRRMQIEQGRLIRRLRERGIEALTLKGVALAARYYGDIGLRPASDIDLLVWRGDAARMAQLLREGGYEPDRGQASVREFYALVTAELGYTRPGGQVVEIHWELSNRVPYRRGLAVGPAWERAITVEIEGERVRYLHPADELRYLSVHGTAQHQLQYLIWAVDVAELVRALPSDWDWDAFVRETVARRLAKPVAEMLGCCHRMLDLELLPGVLADLEDAAASDEELAMWHTARAEIFEPAWVRPNFMALCSWQERATFLRGAVLPGPRTLARLYSWQATTGLRLPSTYARHIARTLGALMG